jgi:ATP-dependent HslUV protease subunit HslV
MSIAVAVKKNGVIAVAADTQENFGDRKVLRTNHRSEKILRVGGSFLAATGWGLYDNVLRDYLARSRPPRFAGSGEVFRFFVKLWKDLRARYTLVNDQAHEDDPTPFADLDSSFLIVNPTGIYQVSGNMSVSVFEEYYAVGSGSPYALGAMSALYATDLDAEAIARTACRVAIEFDVFCGGDVDLFSVPVRVRAARRTRPLPPPAKRKAAPEPARRNRPRGRR